MKGKLFWLGLLPAMLALAISAESSVNHGWLLWTLGHRTEDAPVGERAEVA